MVTSYRHPEKEAPESRSADYTFARIKAERERKENELANRLIYLLDCLPFLFFLALILSGFWFGWKMANL